MFRTSQAVEFVSAGVPILGAFSTVPIIGAMEKSVHTSEYLALCTALRTARESADLSQRELAQRLEVPHSWVSKVETGERRIDLVEFCWFISACGVDPLPVAQRLLEQIVKRRSRGGRGDRPT